MSPKPPPGGRFARWMPPPKAPPYDLDDWRCAPWERRLRLACQAWALQGYGAPLAIHALYVLKVGAYVGGWILLCSFDASGQGLFGHDAFKRAVLWSMAFEVLGLGCSSGPLAGRYMPPVAAPLHFLRPGTIRMPLLPAAPLVGGDRRRWVDAALYAAFLACLARTLTAPEITSDLILPCVALLGLLGVIDKTIFLAARSEHYGAMAVCLLFPDDWLAGAMVVQLSLWLWAAASKLNHHFPSVIGVMTSNSPLLRSPRIRKAMYRGFPDDLRPSRLAQALAHGGTAVELIFPALLVFGGGGDPTWVGLGLMCAFHAYILSNFPMAVPLEWNVMMVYGGFFLFGVHAHVSPADLADASPLLVAFLALSAVIVPLVGNLCPRAVSFLMSMRYYAGNWAYSVWLFRGDSDARLDAHLVKASIRPHVQLKRLYGEDVVLDLMAKVPAFRSMHLHGKALQELLPRAVDDMDGYTYADGEMIAGLALGYNFGDGHLHDHRLLESIQSRCGFAPGELRHVYVESQPLLRPRLRWEIRDAAEGLLDTGWVSIDALRARQPWPPPTEGENA